jgi:hypothetical protein
VIDLRSPFGKRIKDLSTHDRGPQEAVMAWIEQTGKQSWRVR